MQHRMHMIAHHRVRQHGDREDAGQLDQPRLQPGFAVIKAAPRDRVLTAKEGAPHATRHAVIGAGGAWYDEMRARIAHGASMRTCDVGRRSECVAGTRQNWTTLWVSTIVRLSRLFRQNWTTLWVSTI